VTSFRSSPADAGRPLPTRLSVSPHGPGTGNDCEPVQFLSPAGELTSAGEQADISVAEAERFYRDMVLARRLDEEALALQRQGELGLWLMSLGQEAAQVGSIRALADSDYVFPTYREHASALCRGIGPTELLVQWRGNQHCGWDPHDYRFHFYSLVLGTQTLHATGYAMGVQRDQADEVVMAYLGDGAASQGDVSEALNWSAVMRAPVLFFCQNNQWAISTPASAQSTVPLHHRASGFGLDSYVVDGNDVLAVHAVTTAAAERVRNGGGPAFIEAVTYRMAGHSTSDDPTRYRPKAEVEAWRARDPINRLRVFLEGCGAQPAFFSEVDSEADDLAVEVRAACLALEAPSLESAFDTVFVDAPESLKAERDELVAYRSSFADEAPNR
jgi:2-oxoisovalerate dehydrogenase E1 component alpha subunit